MRLPIEAANGLGVKASAYVIDFLWCQLASAGTGKYSFTLILILVIHVFSFHLSRAARGPSSLELGPAGIPQFLDCFDGVMRAEADRILTRMFT